MNGIVWVIIGGVTGLVISKFMGAYIEGITTGLIRTQFTWLVPFVPFITIASFLIGLFWRNKIMAIFKKK